MTDSFPSQLARYKKLIDGDIADYVRHVRLSTREQYGDAPGQVSDAFLELLAAPAKRLRGTLVMIGYEMSGGQNRKMILQAARAIEMLHAYILIIDDIQDRSDMRRGQPTVHRVLEKLAPTDAEHIGRSLALNAALTGSHAAQMMLANLDAPPELRLRALSITNRTMLIVGHGQTKDLLQQFAPDVQEADIEKVMDWKAALYTFINPLHVGMVLAGADCQATDAITPYARHAGLAFQITDDILGVFGDESKTGKPAGDDVREGKQTLLTAYALRHAAAADKKFLHECLGNSDLTLVELKRVRKMLVDCGARAYAEQIAERHIADAKSSLDQEQRRWPAPAVAILRRLVTALKGRDV